MFWVLTCVIAQAQNAIAGKVFEKHGTNREYLVGVNVIVEGTQEGTVSDANGEFSMTINSSLPVKIIFSYVGYTSDTVIVTAVGVYCTKLHASACDLGIV